MDAEAVQAFNSEIASMYEMKPPISKAKIVDITKSAMKAIKYYKHVVFIVEKFLQKCKPEYKIPGLYVIDSIIRQSQHQYKERDVFAPRFAQNIKSTLQILLECSSSDKLKIVRVLNLWKSGKVFEETVVDDLLAVCSENGLETDIHSVELKVKGNKANMDIYSSPNPRKRRKNESDNEPTTSATGNCALELDEPSKYVPENGISEHELLNLIRSVNLDLGGAFTSDLQLLKNAHRIVNDKLVKQRELDTNSHGSIQKLLSREFDYSDEDSGDEAPPRPIVKEPVQLSREEVIRIAGRILDQEDIKTEVKKMAERKIEENGQFISPMPPPAPEQFLSPPPPFSANPPAPPPPPMGAFQMPGAAAFNIPPPIIPNSSTFSQPPPPFGLFEVNDRDERVKRPRSRSPPKMHDGSCNARDTERERRKLCLPLRTKPGHMLLGSCTIWLGKLPANTGENDIRAALSEFGDPLRINILSMKACAYVSMRDRKTAAKIVDRLKNSLQILRKFVKLDWAPGQMVKDRFKHLWDGEFGVAQIPYNEIPTDIDAILDGFYVDIESVPDHLKGICDQKSVKQSVSIQEPVLAAVPSAPSLVSPVLVPQLAPGFPHSQFPFALPPAQALQFLSPGFPLSSLIQTAQESLQSSSQPPVPASAIPVSGLSPPRHSGNGSGMFHSNPNFEPRGNRGSSRGGGGYRNQFFGHQHQGGRGQFSHRPPPPQFPSQDVNHPFTQSSPLSVEAQELSTASVSGDRDRRRSKLFQSEQPRDMSHAP